MKRAGKVCGDSQGLKSPGADEIALTLPGLEHVQLNSLKTMADEELFETATIAF